MLIFATLIMIVVIGAVFIVNNFKANTKLDTILPPNNTSGNQVQGEVKELAMTSFYEMFDGKAKPQYSLKEITVKKGDTVKIEITVTKGNHDFNIDEYNIHVETPLNQPTLVEFKADRTGEFVYYCSMPGHRANGHWGTLTVTE